MQQLSVRSLVIVIIDSKRYPSTYLMQFKNNSFVATFKI